jgi:SAM-dependent methyltransferase
MNESPEDKPLFDTYAQGYDAALAEGISVSGEDKDFFARGRIAWLSGRLAPLGALLKTVLDFGCGTGSATPHLLGIPGITSVIGVDVSSASISIATTQYASAQARFSVLSEYTPAGQVDLAFCNGVFHHIPLAERAAAVSFIRRSLRPGGLFAFWENNPWNPGTRLVMRRIPFDRDAITLSPREARRLLAGYGFEILGTDFQFIFPNLLRWLRPLERPLCRLPFGAQYLVLCRNP